MCAAIRKLTGHSVLGLVVLGLAGGCANNTETGALVGGAAGAGVGAIIGHNSHDRTASGALIGGAVGAISGALVGNQIDKDQARQQQQEQAAAGYDQYQGNVPPPSARYYVARVTSDDVIAWSQRGMRDSDIIDRIDRSGTVFHLNAADEMRLRDAGVSEEVIAEMRETARR